MTAIAICSPKGGAGRTVTARLLAFGLEEGLGQEVTLVELLDRTGSAVAPAPCEDHRTFRLTEGSPDAALVELLQDTTRYVVLDFPAVGTQALARHFRYIDQVLIPLRPSPLDARTAYGFWRQLMTGRGWDSPDMPPGPWMVGIGYNEVLPLLERLAGGQDAEADHPLRLLPWQIPTMTAEDLEQLLMDRREAPSPLQHAAVLLAAYVRRLEVGLDADDLALESLERYLPGEHKWMIDFKIRDLPQKVAEFAEELAVLRVDFYKRRLSEEKRSSQA